MLWTHIGYQRTSAICLLMLASCILLGCIRQRPSASQDPFETVVGARIDPELQLLTTRKQYADNQLVGYQVINSSGTPIYFPDYTYGLRVFVFSEESQRWVPSPLDFDLIDPKIVTVAPGPSKGLQNLYEVPVEFIPSTGRVRLAVVGWIDPSDPGHSRVAAYAEIEIAR